MPQRTKPPQLTKTERKIAGEALDALITLGWNVPGVREHAAQRVADKLRGDTPLEPEAIPNSNEIVAFIHCGLCLEELKAIIERTGQSQSPRTYTRFEVGWTKVGIQVWCRRHEVNVLHMDFEGLRHPANTTKKA